MHLTVYQDRGVWQARYGGERRRCAIGRGGARWEKCEGDGATPIGVWPLRRLFYRPDRFEAPPPTGLPSMEISPSLGWCDEPGDPAYNRLVTLPHGAGHEILWRPDRIYDLVVVMGYNDDPPTPGLGSAIFLHLAREGYGATDGCVAMALDHLLAYLKLAGPGSEVRVCAPEAG